MTCPSCSISVPAGARFCPGCGSAVRLESGAGDALRERLQAAVDDSFQVERLLGRGGMGSVYLAREPVLDRLVAIKVLPPERAQSPDLRERFRREARTAAQLSHPNIVPLLTFGEDEGLMYFVMGYVEGEALSARVQREGRLQTGEAVRVLSELADALGYAHGRGVVHRDIKPENILLEQPKGVVRLTDFGVAKGLASSSALTTEGAVIGTPHYMSPEQASGRADVDTRSDIYSMGALAYTLFTGRPPFLGRNASEILRQHLTQEAPRLRDQLPELPAALDDAIRRCLAKDPAARWNSAPDFAKALQSAGDSWWTSLLRRAWTPAPGLATSRGAAPSPPTPMPTSPPEFLAAAEEIAGRMGAGALADRLRSAASRLAAEGESLDRMILVLQTASDPVELRRAEKRLAALRSVADPPREVTETIDALSRLRLASQNAAARLEAAKSARASLQGSLRRLHGAARRLAAAKSDAAALADFQAACQGAVSEGDTAVATEGETRAGET
ncbi:MAG TPA: serine/threonine-protein kinase [Vicinamibacteria bacterium]|nr:serine/threonine-protein kinase [Vicinamibacteria bacterium]